MLEILIKNLGGFKALRYRIAFLLLAIFITCMPLVASNSQHIEVEEPTTEEVTTEAPTTEAQVEDINVSIALESVEKDIRIGFYDEEGKIISGYEFEVIVKDVNGKEATYADEDKDGFIVIRDIAPGDAVVTPKEASGCVFARDEYTVKVKDHVEYKPIKNVVVKNDGGDKKRVADTSSKVPKNTVEFVESTKTEISNFILVSASDIVVPLVPTTTTTDPPTDPEEMTEETETTTEITTETTTEIPVVALKDKKGNQLYLKTSDGEYIEALSTDYAEGVEFYRKELTYKYTGWQNIDGKMYYYDKDGNYVIGTQVIDGVTYKFSQTGVRGGTIGVDVSSWNGTMNWKKAKSAGVDFAIIRVGFRGYGSGGINDDTRFVSNISGAISAGIKVGVYFYSQAINAVEAVEEASYCVKKVQGYGLSLPIFIDTEDTGSGGAGRADGLSVAKRTAVCKAFCQTVTSAGYRAGVYSGKWYFENKLNAGVLSSYTIWLAQWGVDAPTYKGKYDIWQYSDKGKGSTYGCSGYIDLNYS